MDKNDEKIDQPLRNLLPEKLKAILETHKKWLESEEKKAAQADLRRVNLQEANLEKADLRKALLKGANLQGAFLQNANLQGAYLNWANLKGAHMEWADLQEADLRFADLRGAYLHETKLQKAYLKETNFQGANLKKANLQKAEFLNTKLRDADLQDANLEGAIGLKVEQLGGANVSGAKLHEDIKNFEGLKTVEEISKEARKLFLALLLGCVYSWLTIATTTDARLITNSVSSPLPIIRTAIPIVGFYLVAPLLLLCLYIYFHLYLQRMWEVLTNLPAVFPDGQPLYKRTYSWLLNDLVCSYFVRLKSQLPALFRIQKWLSITLAWVIVPITLFIFWGRYLARRDWLVTIIQVFLLAFSMVAGIMSFRLARATFRGEFRQSLNWREVIKEKIVIKRAGCFLGIFLIVNIIFVFITYKAFNGLPEKQIFWSSGWSYYFSKIDIKEPYTKIILIALENIGWKPYVDLTEEDVSSKPDKWTGKYEEVTNVKGARLRDKDLRHALGFRVFLSNAELQYTDLRWAYLEMADLRMAKLNSANLEGATLFEANLRGADLRGADLRGAYLRGANLRDTDLHGANLRGADLHDADLRCAKLNNGVPKNIRPNLSDFDLEDAYVDGADLRGANLRNADLRGTDFSNTDPSNELPNLNDSDFYNSDLRGADLSGTNLTKVEGLTKEQIESAYGDERTKLPDYLKGKVKLKSKPEEKTRKPTGNR